MVKKLVIIGANDFQAQLIRKAREMGYETHVFAWEKDAVGKDDADFFYPISIVEKDEILAKCREIEPVGVCSIASDLASITVNYVAEKLGLNGNPTAITEVCTNKYAMRKCLMDGGIKVPKFEKVSGGKVDAKNILSEMNYHVVVKPTDRSGSRGITEINIGATKSQEECETALVEAAKKAAELSFEKCAIVEEYIEGNEYSCECISYNGKHHFLSFTKKYTTGAPDYIETGHEEPSDIPTELVEGIKAEILKALDVLGIKNGASHSEFRIDPVTNEARIIEIGARMGGDCIGSDLVHLSTGADFMKMVIDVACDKEPEIKMWDKPVKVGIKFIFSKDDLDKMEEFEKAYPEKMVRKSKMETENLGQAVDSSTRVGYYIYRD